MTVETQYNDSFVVPIAGEITDTTLSHKITS